MDLLESKAVLLNKDKIKSHFVYHGIKRLFDIVAATCGPPFGWKRQIFRHLLHYVVIIPQKQEYDHTQIQQIYGRILVISAN